jgi:RNA polymerase sigma-70 factor (sigma-E family)
VSTSRGANEHLGVDGSVVWGRVVQAADEMAFRDFVHARSATLLRLAYLLTGDRGLAEDAVQGMLAKVYVSWLKIRDGQAADAYCRTVLVREVSSWRRNRQVQHVLTAQVPERPAVVDELSDAEDRVRRALMALPSRQRAVVALRYYADMSESEVAEALGITAGSVKQHTHRANRALRAALTRPELVEENEQ